MNESHVYMKLQSQMAITVLCLYIILD